ncbi:STAS domain-containing protein [Streptomyces sp. NPDC057217]|uniref:STAS domain-containing protein n=1 Tax=Streptomyces sp. NPDC057217 TaxID=3346054 RepID=UPI0036274EE3
MSLDGTVMTRRESGAATSGQGAAEQAGGESLDRPAVLQYEAHGTWVVVASGAYDMETIAPLAAALETAAEKYQTVVLNVSGVTFADSTLLNLLVSTHRRTDLRLVDPTPQVKRILEITGLDTVLTMRETLKDATAC